jgi:hypothetical protein
MQFEGGQRNVVPRAGVFEEKRRAIAGLVWLNYDTDKSQIVSYRSTTIVYGHRPAQRGLTTSLATRSARSRDIVSEFVHPSYGSLLRMIRRHSVHSSQSRCAAIKSLPGE